jgi:hypothetical protein
MPSSQPQARQLAAPVEGWNELDGHAVHAVDPASDAKRPAGQSWQLAAELAPSAAENVPGEQATQAAAPRKSEKVPAAHGSQRALAGCAAKVPALQSVQKVWPLCSAA